MLTAAERSRLTVVLVGARNPSNIGAAARAMQDFGFSDLRIANDFAPPLEAAQLESAAQLKSTTASTGEGPLTAKSAVGAAHILQDARRFDTLAEAIADCSFIAGTTAIGGRELTREVHPLREAAPQLLQALSAEVAQTEERKAALLFGSEKTGLTNEQLSHCSLLLTIPMYAPEQARHLSMNLGQSVAVCLYELTREGFEGSRALPEVHEAAATAEDRERLNALLLEVMGATGYTRRYPHNAASPLVRQLVQQLGRTHRETMTWMGILRQILRKEAGEAKLDTTTEKN